jgi:hypothetical membrane protein
MSTVPGDRNGISVRNVKSRAILSAALLGLALFLALNVVLQLMPPHYSLVSQAVSDLAVGPYGWLMNIAFFLNGLSILTFLAGVFMATAPTIRPTMGLLILGVWGLASLAIAFFPPDIVDAHGYPGAAMAFQRSPTTHGKIHLVIASIVFPSMVLGLLVSSLGLAKDRRLCSLRTPGLLISGGALIGLFLIDPLGVRGFFGIMERSVFLLGLTWVVMVALRLRKSLQDSASLNKGIS